MVDGNLTANLPIVAAVILACQKLLSHLQQCGRAWLDSQPKGACPYIGLITSPALQYRKTLSIPMSDTLYLSLWFPDFSGPAMLPHPMPVLQHFPFPSSGRASPMPRCSRSPGMR